MQDLTDEGYAAIGCLTNEEALNAFTLNNFDAVIIGGGVDYVSRNLFKNAFVKQKPEIKIVEAHPHTILKELQKAFSV